MHFEENFRHFSTQTKNKKMREYMNTYEFLFVTQKLEYETNKKIYQNIEKSDSIIINYFNENNGETKNGYFVIGFKKTILIILQSSLELIYDLLSKKNHLSLIFINEKHEDIFCKNIKYIKIEYPICFIEEIKKLNESLKPTKNEKNIMWKNIIPCISTYIFLQSYNKKIDRFKEKQNQIMLNENIDENEYIILKWIATTTLNDIHLIYHIKKESLLVLKASRLDKNSINLVERELENYKQLSYPLFPKLFGTNKKGDIIIEYIKGTPLDQIKKIKLTNNEKIMIISKLALSILFLHINNFIYRDLKPNNIIIDEYYNPIIIDFDRMIYFDLLKENTVDTLSIFLAPEIQESNSIRFENDIYSFGQMIYYIMCENEPKNPKPDDFGIYSDLYDLYSICTNGECPYRPSIFLIFIAIPILFDIDSDMLLWEEKIKYILSSNINIDNAKKSSYMSCMLKLIINFASEFDIDFFYDVSFKMDSPNDYLILSQIYKDIDYSKSINYLEEGIKKFKDYQAFYLLLGDIYHYNCHDIEKLYECLKKIDRLQNSNIIYLYGIVKFAKSEINDAIYCFENAAMKNNSKAKKLLQIIFWDGYYVEKNIKKAFNYCHPYGTIELFFIYFCKATKYPRISIYHDKLIYDYFLPLKNNEINYFKEAIEHLFQNIRENHDEESIIMLCIFYTLKNNLYIQEINDGLQAIPIDLNSLKNFTEKIVSTEILNEIEKTIKSEANANSIVAQWFLFNVYAKSNSSFDLQKALYYASLAAKQNESWAQFFIGYVYFVREFIKCKEYQELTKIPMKFRMLLNFIYAKIISDSNYLQEPDNFLKYIENILLNVSNVNPDSNIAFFYLKLASNDVNYMEISNFCLNMLTHNMDFTLYETYPAFFPSKECFIGAYLLDKSPFSYNEAIEYFIIGAQKNDNICKYLLGMIYKKRLSFYKKADLSRSLYYFDSINVTDIEVCYQRAKVYEKQKEIRKSLDNYEYAARNNHCKSQIILGSFYLVGKYVKQNVNKGIEYLLKAYNNKYHKAIFALGYLYLVGCDVSEYKQDIDKAVGYFRDGSNLNKMYSSTLYSKNNLGIIYKNGYGGRIKNAQRAIEIFQEAININIFKDCNSVIQYNLAHVFLYDDSIINKNDAIPLLIESSSTFQPSEDLLCIALIRKYGYNISIENINKEFMSAIQCYFIFVSKELPERIIEKINKEDLRNIDKFTEKKNCLKDIDYFFDFPLYQPFISKEHLKKGKCIHSSTNDKRIKSSKKNICKEINNLFYDGFGIGI